MNNIKKLLSDQNLYYLVLGYIALGPLAAITNRVVLLLFKPDYLPALLVSSCVKGLFFFFGIYLFKRYISYFGIEVKSIMKICFNSLSLSIVFVAFVYFVSTWFFNVVPNKVLIGTLSIIGTIYWILVTPHIYICDTDNSESILTMIKSIPKVAWLIIFIYMTYQIFGLDLYSNNKEMKAVPSFFRYSHLSYLSLTIKSGLESTYDFFLFFTAINAVNFRVKLLDPPQKYSTQK